ncbi:type VI secretion protein ImpB [Cognatishimia sp. SS12]|uniref:Y-family DNA polymerase n=1 Tax=Cognatishimia sp. SS12 TaxID=2979465 RepID=UPI0023308D4C|nr:type VI secretion protein ImpB [Cognatishimia sp. SS12]MDC0738471.1 type VI secretion protein ImpB [Cognatishimia sp. SS12]
MKDAQQDHMRGHARGVERLFLDFDSFFASAEQHFNPALRGKPLGVVPLDSPHTSCIAISREAKALGLSGHLSIAEARARVPDMIFVVARHDVYVDLHNDILEVIESCLPISQVRSIDELVCELLPSEAAEGAALAARIKRALCKRFSAALTCSIGMAPTELLAKIAAEASKPDGFALVQAQELPERFAQLSLDDLPGISRGMSKRLAAAGVQDFCDLWSLAPKQARALWGNVEGERFWNGLHGYHVKRPAQRKGMFGHSRNLPHDWQDPQKAGDCARQLCLSAARRLRRTDMSATKLTLSFSGRRPAPQTRRGEEYLRWDHQEHFLPARDDQAFLTALRSGLAQARRALGFRPRSVTVMLHGLRHADEMTDDLFDQHPVAGTAPAQRRAQWERVSETLDLLRARHGPEVISLGPRTEIPGGYLGAKIVFGRIPDAADFNEAPKSPRDTHFCTLPPLKS